MQVDENGIKTEIERVTYKAIYQLETDYEDLLEKISALIRIILKKLNEPTISPYYFPNTDYYNSKYEDEKDLSTVDYIVLVGDDNQNHFEMNARLDRLVELLNVKKIKVTQAIIYVTDGKYHRSAALQQWLVAYHTYY